MKRFLTKPLHEAINNKAEQRKIQMDILGQHIGINPYYIFSDNRPAPKADNIHDWMNN